jgi:hypothetical protein
MMQIRLALAVVLAVVGCEKKDDLGSERGAAPPPVQSARPGACASGGGKVGDATSAPYFPRVVGDYCLDPNGEAQAFGEGAPGSLDKVCTEKLDGECEVYKGLGLRRFVAVRYVDGKGSPATIDVNLSRFSSAERAFAFYTKRVVADGDPAATTMQSIDAGGAGVLGSGNAVVWRGEHVAELTYANELEPPDQMAASAKRLLPPVAAGIGGSLPGETKPLPAVAALPAEHRLPLGIAYAAGDLLEVHGAGPGAVGYYRSGERRWRVLGAVRPDEAGAADVTRTLAKLEGATTLKSVAFPAVAFTLRAPGDGPKLEGVIGRKGPNVLGIGDEEHALGTDVPAAEAEKKRLGREEKIQRLTSLLGG